MSGIVIIIIDDCAVYCSFSYDLVRRICVAKMKYAYLVSKKWGEVNEAIRPLSLTLCASLPKPLAVVTRERFREISSGWEKLYPG